jgi:hypothetical protein
MGEREFSPQRLWNCEYFVKQQCPSREALRKVENLVTEMVGGHMIRRKPEAVGEGITICSKCNSFEPKKRR